MAESWDYSTSIRQITARFRGRPGVVLHVGDSITYSNPYGQWARHGEGRTEADKAVLQWMHAGRDDDRDGWWLARFDHPDGGRSHTACSGLRTDELLAGGKRGLMSLDKMLTTYQPQIVVLLCGTNDATAQRPAPAYLNDAQRAIEAILARDCICILSTLPPHHHRSELVAEYNRGLRQLAEKKQLPLIDFEREILTRRPEDWNGTLLNLNDVHPTASRANVQASSAPTDANLRECGYLLRGWLSVRKIAEVKRRAIDGVTIANGSQASRSTDRPGMTATAPAGKPTRFAVTRDTRLSSYPGETEFSPGGASQIKLKSNQEMGLVDFDPSGLAGQVITGGQLWVRLPPDARETLDRVTIASVSQDWFEGTNGSSSSVPGASSFAWRRNPDLPWTTPGSDFTSATLGATGTCWHSAQSSPPDANGWQVIPVDSRVLAARVAGLSHGCVVFDDTGSQWKRDGEKFTASDFPNRFFFSRDSNRERAPYFVIFVEGEDREPPAAPTDIQVAPARGQRRDLIVSWKTPADRGRATVIGFRARIDGRDVEPYLVPLAGPSGQRVTMLLRDWNSPRAATLALRAVDGAGNVGDETTIALPPALAVPTISWPEAPEPFASEGPAPMLGDARIAVVDTLDKFDPRTGALVGGAGPASDERYLQANHLWSASRRHIRLHAARGEIVSFQLVAHGRVGPLQPRWAWRTETGIPVSLSRPRHVATQAGIMPDPLVPLDARGFSVPAGDEEIAGQTCGSLIVEFHVPRKTAPGLHRATLALDAGGGSPPLALDVSLQVWDFELPDQLSFLAEMNCYGLPENERAYYRLAHRHRTVLNRLPYHQNGSVAPGAAPAWDGRRLDFAAWDRRFGPLLDGSAFQDLPRAGIPIECFYLPLHENWPTSIHQHYNGSYWADEAFTVEYRAAFVEAARQFATHAHERGWLRTRFHGFLNNKVMYKSRGWSRGSSPWLLDEPSHFQDYWALRYFGEAFHEGVRLANGKAIFPYRCDISRPQWQRDTLDGLLDYNVVSSGAFQQYRSLILHRRELFPQEIVIYGAANDPATRNIQGAAWCVDAWTLGADGILPWQTVGSDQSWKTGEATCLFYPGEPVGLSEPVPSLRLKSFLRGQQDVEYLVALARHLGLTQMELGTATRALLPIQGERRGTGFRGDEDAGVMQYDRLTPLDLWQLRQRVARRLESPR